MEILQPADWAPPRGYSNGITARGRLVLVAGQVGWNPRTGEFESDNLAAQVRRALQNVAAVLRAGGGEPRHVVRLTWYVTDRQAYVDAKAEIGVAYREVFGRHFPPMTLVVVASLLEERARVEIEATAVVPD